MDSSTSMFTEEFRSIHTMRAEEPGEVMEMRMVMSDICRFDLRQQRLNGHAELVYRAVNRSERWTIAAATQMEVEIPSMPQLNTRLLEARALERPDDFRDQINVRCRMLLTKLGRQHNAVAVGLTPPLWRVGVSDLQRWLTAEDLCEVSVHERVEYTVSDDRVVVDPPVEQGDRMERLEIGLGFTLRMVSAARQATEHGGGYDIQWRVEALKAEKVFPDPQAGIDRVDSTGSSQGVASFDASGVLISLTGTGASQSDMSVNSRYRGHDGRPHVGTLSQVMEHEISVRRV